jgi:hypothetical protein
VVNVSPQKLALITDIARTEVLLLTPLDLYLSTLSGPIAKGRVRAGAELRLKLGNYIMERLVALGLERVKKRARLW